METDQEYFVFISYSSLDNEWALWLRHELEHYHLPASFNGRTDVRENLREVFHDRDELGAGSVIMCGVTIGKWAMVAAGSVVLKDVPDGAMVVSNPAR